MVKAGKFGISKPSRGIENVGKHHTCNYHCATNCKNPIKTIELNNVQHAEICSAFMPYVITRHVFLCNMVFVFEFFLKYLYIFNATP